MKNTVINRSCCNCKLMVELWGCECNVSPWTVCGNMESLVVDDLATDGRQDESSTDM